MQERLKEMGLMQGDLFSQHRLVLTSVASQLTAHLGVTGLSLGGSLSRGQGDAYSDLDVTVYISPSHFEDVWLRRHQLTEVSGMNLLDLSHQWGDDANLRNYAVMYTGGVYLDLTLVQSSQCLPDEVPLWSRNPSDLDSSALSQQIESVADVYPDELDDAIRMFWLGAVLCAKYILRNDLWNALSFIQSRRDLFLVSWRLTYRPERADWGWYKVNEDVPGQILDQLALTVTEMNPSPLAKALRGLMSIMDDAGPALAKHYGTEYPHEATLQISEMVHSMLINY